MAWACQRRAKAAFHEIFRAENARRQRPDGTGIGLYLAKKVIHGHGGSLIFESELGKGSTFDFGCRFAGWKSRRKRPFRNVLLSGRALAL